MLTKLTKIKCKERIFKVAREKSQVTYKGHPICLKHDLSTESPQARRKWQDIFKILKGKNLQPRLLYLPRISFKIDGKSKSFSGKQKLRELSTTKPAFTTNVKGTYLIRKYKRTKRSTKESPKLRKWQKEHIYQ